MNDEPFKNSRTPSDTPKVDRLHAELVAGRQPAERPRSIGMVDRGAAVGREAMQIAPRAPEPSVVIDGAGHGEPGFDIDVFDDVTAPEEMPNLPAKVEELQLLRGGPLSGWRKMGALMGVAAVGGAFIFCARLLTRPGADPGAMNSSESGVTRAPPASAFPSSAMPPAAHLSPLGTSAPRAAQPVATSAIDPMTLPVAPSTSLPRSVEPAVTSSREREISGRATIAASAGRSRTTSAPRIRPCDNSVAGVEPIFAENPGY